MLARFFARSRPQCSVPQRRTIGHSTRKIPKASHAAPQPKETSLPNGAKTPNNRTEGESPKDFRSPWLFKAVGVANFVLLPVVGIYAAFYWDWGDDREHVMQPVRRWLGAQRDTFFSLSPPEQELATPGLTLPPLQSDVSLTEAPSAELPKGFFKPFFLVKAVDPEGPAAIAGLRDDDLIITFGETPVRSLPPLTYQAMIKSALKENNAIPVVVMRPGKYVLLSLTPTKEAGLGCDLQRYQPGQVNR